MHRLPILPLAALLTAGLHLTAGSISFSPSSESDNPHWSSSTGLSAARVEDIDLTYGFTPWQLPFFEIESTIEDSLVGLPVVYGPYALPEPLVNSFLIPIAFGGPSDFSLSDYEATWAEFVRISNERVGLGLPSPAVPPSAPDLLAPISSNSHALFPPITIVDPATGAALDPHSTFSAGTMTSAADVPEVNSSVAVLIGALLIGLSHFRRRRAAASAPVR